GDREKVLIEKKPAEIDKLEWDRETLIYDRDNLSFEDVKGHLLSKDKLNNDFGSNSKSDRQVLVLVASRKRDKKVAIERSYVTSRQIVTNWKNKKVFERNEEDLAGANLANDMGDDFLLVSTIEGGVVLMGNGSPSKVIDIDTVQIRMHDGTIRTLINIESSDINVSRRALVLMKCKKIGSLYVMEGSKVTNEIGHPLSIKELKLTRLKRRQLGHRREKLKIKSLPTSKHNFDSVHNLHSLR
ncbi:hypothetical protein Gotri_006042, partial [Gossypium trilobum]|nr:hypothetical protein [Gossypium trilobum]